MGIFDFFKKKKKKETAILNPTPRPAPVSSPAPKPEPSPVAFPPVVKPEPVSEKIVKEIVVPSVKAGKKIKYHYDHVQVFTPKDFTIDYDHVIPGDEVIFVQDPSNVYDPHAVLIKHPSCNLGYLYKNKLYNMANEYLNAGLPVYGHIDSMDDEENKLTVFMAFYGAVSVPQKTKPYKLTGTKGKAAQEAIDSLSEGDEVFVEYDYEKEKYIVHDYMGENIGSLPKSAEEHAEDKSCFVDSIEEDDNGKNDVFVIFE